jgi:hypothetical protein
LPIFEAYSDLPDEDLYVREPADPEVEEIFVIERQHPCPIECEKRCLTDAGVDYRNKGLHGLYSCRGERYHSF